MILRDLFQGDDGGWLQGRGPWWDRLVAARLEREAEAVRAEGWKWIEVAPDFAYGHIFGMRQLRGEVAPLTEVEAAARDALRDEYDRIEAEHADAEELSEEADRRLGEIETALAALEDRPAVFEPDEVARAGAFVSIDPGRRRADRARLRPPRGRAAGPA